VTNIDAVSFQGCTSLTSITVDEENTKYMSVDGVLFTKSTNVLVQYPGGKIGSYDIPDGTTSIEDAAFGLCSGITGVNIASSVKTIGLSAFKACPNLEYVTMMPGVEAIGDFAFSECSKLKRVTIPSSVISIGAESFSHCTSLTSIEYDGVTNPCADFNVIGDTISAFKGCKSIKSICLPKGYLDGVFCARYEFCRTDSCENLNLYSDHCYEETCWNGTVVNGKRSNATEWEFHSNGCADYQCHRQLGPIQWRMCNNTKQHKFMCMNDGCLLRDQMFSVEISFKGVKEYELNRTEVKAQIEALTGLEIEDVGVELGEDAYVLNVIVIVDDENTGNIIVDAVVDMERGDNCQYGSLCQSTSARLVVNAMNLSSAMSVHNTMIIAPVMLLFCLIISFITNK